MRIRHKLFSLPWRPEVGRIGGVDDLEDPPVGRPDEEDVVGATVGSPHLRVHRQFPELARPSGIFIFENDKVGKIFAA